MRAMKNSGIEWIGEIPRGWDVERLKYHAQFNPQTVLPDYSDEDQVTFIPMDSLKSGFHLHTVSSFGKVKKGYVSFSENDILMAKVTPCLENGNLAIATNLINGVGFGSTEINVIRCYDIKTQYLFYLLQCPSYIEKATFSMFGVAGLKRLEPEFIPNSYFPMPPQEDQMRITDYLNAKCAEIDALIAAKERTNALLKERRQSIIYEAVTKGLDPTAPMKDSGVEWIGKIPEGWSVGKTIYALSMPITDGPHETPELLNDGIPFVSAEAVSSGNGRIDFDHIRGFISKEYYEECSKKYKPQINDIYMIKSGATTGKVALVDTDRIFTIWSPLAVFRADDERCNYRYLFYFLQSDAYQKQVETKWTYGTQQNIGMRSLEKLLMCFPPVDEQVAIADHLDKSCDHIGELIRINDAAIQQLKEYRQSLIYEAVTGKIEV